MANAYTGFFAGEPSFRCGQTGVQRVGFYAMAGEASTYYLTSGGGIPIAGSGIGNKSFSREGFVGQFYFGPHVGLTVVTQHGSDNAWFGQGYGNAEATDGNGGTTCTTHSQRLPSEQCAGNNASRGIAGAQLERRLVRGSLHLQSAADLHRPV
jgi:hypothetical protein